MEALVPEDCLPLRTAEKGEELASNAGTQTPWGFLKIHGADNHLKSTQKEKAGATRQPSDSSPDPVFLRELNRPKSSQLTPHMGTPWMGWLSAVTSVKTQPSSGNSLYFVLFLESNYHLVVCCHREVLFFCISKHKM